MVNTGWQQQNSALLDKISAHRFDSVIAEIAWEAHTSACRRRPVEQVWISGEEGVEPRDVRRDDRAIAIQDDVPRTQRHHRQDLGRSGVADRGVVLCPLEPAKNGAVTTGNPADTQA